MRFEKGPSKVPATEERLTRMHEARSNARRLLEAAKTLPVKAKFEEGDQVWLEGRNLKTYHPSKKLAPRRYGPFRVEKKIGEVAYKVTLPEQWEIHNVFHVDLLSPYTETEEHGANYERPAPEFIEGEDLWEVEKVLDTRLYGRRRKRQYLVSWKGFPQSENSWVNHEDMNADELIEEFNTRLTPLNQTKKRRGRRRT